MKYSYNWLKWYVPDAPEAEKLSELITYHLFEVESLDKLADGDSILDIKILPNRAHDLLSHQGLAKEISSLLQIPFVDPTPKYKVPPSNKTDLQIKIESENCRRYMGRVVRNVKVGPSPDWVMQHLASIGQRSINNMVDAANIVMFDCGQPTHIFDLNKVKDAILVRQAKTGEEMTTLDNKELKLRESDLVIADSEKVLGLAGIKGGKAAEVTNDTTDIIIEVANFDATSIRKSAQHFGIFTDARKRFENDLSPELGDYAMLELSALIMEMCPEAVFEEVVDQYPKKQEQQKLSFNAEKIAKILGTPVSVIEIGNILERYKIGYKNEGDHFEIIVPPMRLDLNIEEDMAEEVGRVLGYDKLNPQLPKINFTTQTNDTYTKISALRNKLLSEGYNEVMTYAFASKGKVEVLESASDKKFLRANLTDGLTESLKLNKINAPFLELNEVKIFEIGVVWTPQEEIHVAYNEKHKIIEKNLDEASGDAHPKTPQSVKNSFDLDRLVQNFSQIAPSFSMWSLYPFIARDISVWTGEGEGEELKELLKENAGELLMKGPYLFDSFTKEGKTSYAYRMVFQSYERTLTDDEVGKIMEDIKKKVEAKGWTVR